MKSPRSIVLGTRNKKKLRELRILLDPLGIELHTLDEFPNSIEVEENGTSFQENAQLKASQQAKIIGEWVLGEDSGLCVAALNGAPGIYSARFSGPNATDALNNLTLLEKLNGVPLEKRNAHYVCHMSLSDPNGKIHIDCEAYCRGRILEEQKGSAGFGYDPMFEIPEYHLTFGELGDNIKAVLSHRARATRMFVVALVQLLKQESW